MPLPRPSLHTSEGAFRRPAVVASVTTLALAAVLGAGVFIASATESGALDQVQATAGPDPASAGPGGTTSGGDDNTAVAVNTKDGSTVYAVRLKVVLTGADTVDSGNAAVAAASCSDCQTVAIALEGVIVTGDAEVVAPENIALAINSECSNCQTLAYAYQNLQMVDGKVRITGAGRQGIARLRQELTALRTSGLDVVQVKEEVDRIAGEFASILADEVLPIGRTGADTGPPTGATPGPIPGPSAGPSVEPAPPTDATTSDAAEPGTTQTTPDDPPPAPASDVTTTPEPSATG